MNIFITNINILPDEQPLIRQQDDVEQDGTKSWYDSYVTPEQVTELKNMVETLAAKYDLTHLICFACRNKLVNDYSCFADEQIANDLHYFLLCVTKGTARLEHDVQDYINAHFHHFRVTALSHSHEAVRSAVAQGNRFFVEVFRQGAHLFHNENFPLNIRMPNLNPKNTLVKAERHFHSHIKMAWSFLEAAATSIRTTGHYETGVFLLHQAVEQGCIALIKVHMGYRIDLHSLSRLLNLCRCFSVKPADLFINEDAETTRLFRLLQESYSRARYSNDFVISDEDADKLLAKSTEFLSLGEDLCMDWIAKMRTAVSSTNTGALSFDNNG